MQFTKNTKGFTLIELLVVITIIGILAVGGTSVYTSQIQKARDSTRMNDLNALKAGVEQAYQDETMYPEANESGFSGSVLKYVPVLPKDPKFGQTCNKTASGATGDSYCDYRYDAGGDANGMTRWAYELSTAFESSGNMTSKAANGVDGGNDPLRWEIGLRMDNISTTLGTNAAGTSTWLVELSGSGLVIRGN